MLLREGFRGLGTLQTKGHGEVSVTLASGVPVIEGAGKSCKVSVHPSTAKHAVGGYLFRDSTLFKILQKAEAEGFHVLLRVERQRKRGVDVDIPLAELVKDLGTARDSVVNTCVGVYDFNAGRWVLESNFSDPVNDPVEADDFIGFVQNCVDVDEESFFSSVQQVEPVKKVFKPSFFDRQNELTTLYFFVVGCEQKYGFVLNRSQRFSVVLKLEKLVGAIQKIILNSDMVDYRDYSRVRSRFMVFNFEEHVKAFDEDALKNLNAWMRECLSESTQVLEWTVSLDR